MSTASRRATEKELRLKLGELAFEFRGITKSNSHLLFVHPLAGPVIASGNAGSGYEVKEALREARRKIAAAESQNQQFVRWLLKKYGVPDDGQAEVRLKISEEAQQYLFDVGQRGNTTAIQSYVSKIDQIKKLDSKNPALYRLTGPLHGLDIEAPSSGHEDEYPEGKPVQLVHRFNDTTKMALTSAGIVTVPQLERLKLHELEAIPRMGRTRVREVWDFFGRGDPYQVKADSIDHTSLSRRTRDLLKADGVETKQQLCELSADDLSQIKGVTPERFKEIIALSKRDPSAWHNAKWNVPSTKEDAVQQAANAVVQELPNASSSTTGLEDLTRQLVEAASAPIRAQLSDEKTKTKIAIEQLESAHEVLTQLRDAAAAQLDQVDNLLSLLKDET